ncbi:MAG: sulfatase-like hydrolase/transferase [Saprospiraceae bacterium]|nr:sulfatase-like hydrolase/transferase [Saprospiraceae bacterium]
MGGIFMSYQQLTNEQQTDLPNSNKDKPNILFILADDVGQEVLSCYGGESYKTPHIDELARTGMRFQHTYSMPTCVPSRLTIMTGKYPTRFGDISWGDFPKSAEQNTFSNLMLDNGYVTGIAGKWQLCLLKDDPQHPARLGFQHSELFGRHEGPRYYEPLIYRNGHIRSDTKPFYGPDLYTRSIIEFMTKNQNKPFLAYYSMALCHEVTDDLETPVPRSPFDRYDSYPEMVAEMDRAVGRLVAALNALKLREKTLILFVADNGTPQNLIVRAEGKELIKEPIFSMQNGIKIPGGKATLTDGGTRVPMITNWPGTIKEGQVVEDLVDFTDFLPTFLDLAQAPQAISSNIDGFSFSDLLHGKGKSKRTWTYAEESVLPKPGGTEPSGVNSGLHYIRNVHWKLYNDGRLYDMINDRFEQAPILFENDTEISRNIRKELDLTFNSKFDDSHD